MAWIESHTVLARHRKVAELAEKLGVTRAQALGHLHALWHAALEQQEDGNLQKWTDKFIAEAALWERRSEDFLVAMRETGFLDGHLLHDWVDYAGPYLTRKYKESNRQKLIDIWRVHGRKYGGSKKEAKKLPLEEAPRKPTLPNLTIPDLTLPNQTLEKTTSTDLSALRTVAKRFTPPTPEEVTTYAQSIGFQLDGHSFCDFYASKGWVVGKQPMKDWKAAIRTWRKNNFGGSHARTTQPDHVAGYAAPIPGKYADVTENARAGLDEWGRPRHV